MPRLVTFGCSYTFGLGLPDVHPLVSIKDTAPSKFAWPNLLASKLGYDCINNSVPGSGNLEILLKVFQTEYQPDDVVIVGWSHFTRYDFYKIVSKNYDGARIYEKDKNFKKVVLESKFSEINYQLNSFVKNWLCISHANLFLTTMGIKNYFYLNTTGWEAENKPEYIPVDGNLNIYPEDYTIDQALDNAHAGLKSQELLAHLMYNKINNELR